MAAAPRPPRQSLAEGPEEGADEVSRASPHRMKLERTVDGLLGGSRSVDGGHEGLNNGELVVEDLGQGREAVGRAGRVTDDSVGRVVGVEVDTCSV